MLLRFIEKSLSLCSVSIMGSKPRPANHYTEKKTKVTVDVLFRLPNWRYKNCRTQEYQQKHQHWQRVIRKQLNAKPCLLGTSDLYIHERSHKSKFITSLIRKIIMYIDLPNTHYVIGRPADEEHYNYCDCHLQCSAARSSQEPKTGTPEPVCKQKNKMT